MWFWSALLVILVLLAGFLVYHFRDQIRAKLIKSTKNSGFPGKLIGPIKSTRASQLNPQKIIYWTNYYRSQNNLAQLTSNTLLTKAAQEKVNDMFSKQYFEHVSPSGVSPSDLVTSVGYAYKVSGENLALGDFLDEKDLVDAWMNSPGHRANILNKDYSEIGVATGLGKFEDRTSTWLAVQEFGKPLPNCSKPNKSEIDDINSKFNKVMKFMSKLTINPKPSHIGMKARHCKIKLGIKITKLKIYKLKQIH